MLLKFVNEIVLFYHYVCSGNIELFGFVVLLCILIINKISTELYICGFVGFICMYICMCVCMHVALALFVACLSCVRHVCNDVCVCSVVCFVSSTYFSYIQTYEYAFLRVHIQYMDTSGSVLI